MKLPDFSSFEPLNRLKAKMGVPREILGTFGVSASGLTPAERASLGTTEGLDVDRDKVVTLEDGTLAYKDSRVLLYIRDWTLRKNEPKFHVSDCTTLQEMRATGREKRYVATTSTSGKFKVNFIQNNDTISEIRNLVVCRNCLSLLSFDGYGGDLSPTKKTEIVKNFDLGRFFAKYPVLFKSVEGYEDADNAPLNVYPVDWARTSREFREDAGWICHSQKSAQCKKDLSASDQKKFLHVHHKNGQRNDVSRDNLVAVCIACHAEESWHAHLKNSPDYGAYVNQQGRKRRTKSRSRYK